MSARIPEGRREGTSHARNSSSPARRAPVDLAAPVQVGLDERVDLAVEHGGHVARLVARPLVFDELVRRQRVRTDLAPERDLALFAAQRFQLPALLLTLACGQARRED